MKICERAVNFIQIYNDLGVVRSCGWTEDGYFGSLLNHTFDELYHGDIAMKFYERLSKGDYSKCNCDDCPWLANNEIEDHRIEIDEIPQYPGMLSLSYENICNYNCTSCNIHERYLNTDKTTLQNRYNIIESKIADILPHIKCISANGQGEVFASKRILKLLAEWKPLFPEDECSVILETNGSLFDEKHWEIIDNLGKYHLKVIVSVMGFQEKTYQYLSGTHLPVSQIINNLNYIKSLREKNIVDYFTIATVVQEYNFRELPEFTRKCIEEFNADYVRLRSFVPWGKKSLEEEWFTDVINPHHPCHNEYLEIMKDDIFKHPKVHDWSGGIGTHLGEHPWKKKSDLSDRKLKILELYFNDNGLFKNNIKDKLDINKKIIVYGIGVIGKAVYTSLKKECSFCLFLDQYSDCDDFDGILILKLQDVSVENYKDAQIIISPIGGKEKIKEDLVKKGFFGKNIFYVEDFFGE